MADTFCPLPWIHVSARSNGNARLCCHANTGPQRILTTSDGRAINYATDSFAEARNAPLLKAVRTAALAGERHPACVRCWKEEDSGMRSRRQTEIALRSDFTPDHAHEHTAADGTVDGVEPTFFDIRFGNLCNLKCRMCGPQESSSWYDDYVALGGTPVFKDTSITVTMTQGAKGRWTVPPGTYDWHDSEHFWNELNRASGAINHIYMAGGEPLLIDRHYAFLEDCVARGHAANMVLEYNTNITNVHQRALDLWPHFKRVMLGCSVDGTGSVNDYIRHPSRFSAIERNLDKIDRLGGNIVAWIACTVSVFNILNFPDFLKWKCEKRFKAINNPLGSRPLLTPHPLHQPDHYSMRILPDPAKHIATDKLRAFLPWLDGFIEANPDLHPNRSAITRRATEMVEGYVAFLWADDLSPLLPTFWRLTKRLDEIRGERLEDSIPDLYDLIKHTQP